MVTEVEASERASKDALLGGGALEDGRRDEVSRERSGADVLVDVADTASEIGKRVAL